MKKNISTIDELKALRAKNEKLQYNYILAAGVVIMLSVIFEFPFSESLHEPISVNSIAIAIFYFVALFALYEFYQQYRATFWIPIQCDVIDKDYDIVHTRGGHAFHPKLYYRYIVNEKEYISDILRNGMPGSFKKEKAMKKLENYSIGNKYQCYYNPSDPNQAVMINEMTAYPLYILLGGTIIAYCFSFL